MKGLILKDIYGLKAYGKTILVLFAVYFITSMYSKSNTAMSAFIGVFCMILPITSFTYDKYYKWDEFAASLPLGRSKIVLAKYVFTLLIVVLAMLLTTIISTIPIIASPDGFNMPAITEALLSNCMVMSVYMLLPAIMLPVMFKFGPEKGRIIIFILIGAFSAGAVSLVSLLAGVTSFESISLSGIFAPIAYLMLLASLVLLFISYFIACALYKSRDL